MSAVGLEEVIQMPPLASAVGFEEVVQALPLKPQRRATDAAETRYAVIAAEHHL